MYYEPASKADVVNAFFDLNLEPPEFLPYQDIVVEPADPRECQYIFSDAESIGNLNVDGNEFELSVSVNQTEGDDSDEVIEEDFSLHFHLNFTADRREDFNPLIESVLETVSEVRLNTLSTYYQIETDFEEWDLSGPIPEESQLARIYLDSGENLQTALVEYNNQTIVSLRHSDDQTFNLDNFFQELEEYIEHDRELAQEFLP